MPKLPNYDVTLEYSTTQIGLMLASSQEGQKLWRAYYAPTFSQQQFIKAEYASFPPEQELIWAQDDWSNGFGQEDYDEPGFYADAENVDGRFKGQLILSPLLTYTAPSSGTIAFGVPYFCVFGNTLYLGAGRYLYTYDYTGEDWGSTAEDFGVGETITDLKVYNGYMYIALNSSTKYYYTANGTSFTQSTAADGYAEKFVIVQDTLWKLKSNGDVKSTTDGTNSGTWSSSYQMGDTSDVGRNLLSLERVLFIFKDSGAFTIDSYGEKWRLFNSPSSTQETNYLAVKEWQGYGFFATGDLGLQVYYRGILQGLHPRRFAPKNTHSVGYARAMEATDSWFYLGLTKCPLLAGQFKVMADGGVDFAWHPLWYAAQTETIVRALQIHKEPSGNTRLWIGFAKKNATNDYQPGYLILPGGSDNPRTDPYSHARYCATGTITTGYWDAGFKDIDKAFLYLTLNSESLTGTAQTIKVDYQVDGGASWLEWGGTGNGTYNISPSQTKYSYAGSTALTGKRIRLRFTFVTTGNTITPVLTSFVLHARLRPTMLKMFDFTALAGNSVMLKDGKTVSKNLGSAEIARVILAQAEAWPITLYDRRGSSTTVSILSPTPEEVELVDNHKNIETAIRLLAIEAKTA